jgi:hypothetical protein
MHACCHHYDGDDLNPYHFEGDCWSHTMMVCKVAEMRGHDRSVQLAALLHDIGKPACRAVNPHNQHVSFFGHEGVSAWTALPILRAMQREALLSPEEVPEVFALIALHSLFYQTTQEQALVAKFRYARSLYSGLVELVACDGAGRFAVDAVLNTQQRDDRLELAGEMKYKEPVVSDAPFIEIVIGIDPRAEASYLAKRHSEGFAGLVLDTKRMGKEALNKALHRALSERRDILITGDTLSRKKRRGYFHAAGDTYCKRATLLLETSAEALQRAAQNGLLRSFGYPLYDEVDLLSLA